MLIVGTQPEHLEARTKIAYLKDILVNQIKLRISALKLDL